MKALITGAGGFVGPYLTAHLESMGDEVVGTDAEVDITDAEGIRKAFLQVRPEVVYHLAAASHVGTSWSAPVDVVRVNVEGSLNVFLAALEAGVERVLLIGSAEQYGRLTPDLLPVAETTPMQPVSPYGASKAGAEMMASHVFHGRGLPVVSVRAFNHLGPGQSEGLVASAIAKQVAEAERDGGGIVRTGNLEARRDFTDVRDVVRAYRALADRGEPGAVYNVCSGVTRSARELLVALGEVADVSVDHQVDPAKVRAHEVFEIRGANDLVSSVTGWRPEIALETTLRDTLAWWRERG